MQGRTAAATCGYMDPRTSRSYRRPPVHLGSSGGSGDAGVKARLCVAPMVMPPNGSAFGLGGDIATGSRATGIFSSLRGANGFTTSSQVETSSPPDGTIASRGEAVIAVAQRRSGFGCDHRESGKTIALFRCTQMLLTPEDYGES